MFLQDININNYIDHLKEQSIVVESLELKFNAKENKMFIESYGQPGIKLSEEDYYENIRDYLEYTSLSWLTPFIQKIKKGVTVDIQVLQDGTFEDSNIHLALNIELGDRVKDVASYTFRTFEVLSQYQKFVNSVEFKGNQNKLRNIVFNISLNAKEFVKALQKGKQNVGSWENWLTITDIAAKKSMEQYKFYSKVPMVNGKLVWNVRKEKIATVFKGVKHT